MKTRSYPFLSITVGAFVSAASLAWADASNMVPESVEHFSIADANANDVLSPAEFRNFVALEAEDGIGASRMIKRFRAYGRAFKRLDTDEDGAVTRDALGVAQARL